MFPRELLDCRLQSLSTSLRENFRAEMVLFNSATIPAYAKKTQGAARIISFKTSQYPVPSIADCRLWLMALLTYGLWPVSCMIALLVAVGGWWSSWVLGWWAGAGAGLASCLDWCWCWPLALLRCRMVDRSRGSPRRPRASWGSSESEPQLPVAPARGYLLPSSSWLLSDPCRA
jgi:hypothetical protein